MMRVASVVVFCLCVDRLLAQISVRATSARGREGRWISLPRLDREGQRSVPVSHWKLVSLDGKHGRWACDKRAPTVSRLLRKEDRGLRFLDATSMPRQAIDRPRATKSATRRTGRFAERIHDLDELVVEQTACRWGATFERNGKKISREGRSATSKIAKHRDGTAREAIGRGSRPCDPRHQPYRRAGHAAPRSRPVWGSCE